MSSSSGSDSSSSSSSSPSKKSEPKTEVITGVHDINFVSSKSNIQQPLSKKEFTIKYAPKPQRKDSGIPQEFGDKKHHNYRQLKEERKQKADLEKNYAKKYGKGLEMLKKMGGYEVGKGVGKNEQGTTEIVTADVGRERAQGIGNQPIRKEATEKDHELEQAKLKRQKLDQEDKEFMSLLKKSRVR